MGIARRLGQCIMGQTVAAEAGKDRRGEYEGHGTFLAFTFNQIGSC